MAAVRRFLRQLSNTFARSKSASFSTSGPPSPVAQSDDAQAQPGNGKATPSRAPERKGTVKGKGKGAEKSGKARAQRSKSLEPRRRREEGGRANRAPHSSLVLPHREEAHQSPSRNADTLDLSNLEEEGRGEAAPVKRKQPRLPRSTSAKTPAEQHREEARREGMRGPVPHSGTGEASPQQLLAVNGLGISRQRSASISATLKKRLYNLSELTFTMDVLQHQRWVLSHTATGVDGKRPTDHFFDVVMGLPLVEGLQHDFLPGPRPKDPTDFLIPDEWREGLTLNCVISGKASSGTGFNPAGAANLRKWKRGLSLGREQDLLRQQQQQEEANSMPAGPSAEFSTTADRVWYLPSKGSSFPAAYCIQFRSLLIQPGTTISCMKPGDMHHEVVVTLELRRASDNGRSETLSAISMSRFEGSGGEGNLHWWHAIRISVQVVKMGELAGSAPPLPAAGRSFLSGNSSRMRGMGGDEVGASRMKIGKKGQGTTVSVMRRSQSSSGALSSQADTSSSSNGTAGGTLGSSGAGSFRHGLGSPGISLRLSEVEEEGGDLEGREGVRGSRNVSGGMPRSVSLKN